MSAVTHHQSGRCREDVAENARTGQRGRPDQQGVASQHGLQARDARARVEASGGESDHEAAPRPLLGECCGAETSRVCCDRGAVGRSRLSHGEAAGRQGHQHQRCQPDRQHSEPTVGPTLQPDLFASRLLVGFRARPRSVHEVLLQWGQSHGRGLLPLQDAAEPDATVELAVGPSQRVPRSRSCTEVLEDAAAVGIVVDPAAEPGPGADQGLVRERDHALVGGQQPGARPSARRGHGVRHRARRPAGTRVPASAALRGCCSPAAASTRAGSPSGPA